MAGSGPCSELPTSRRSILSMAGWIPAKAEIIPIDRFPSDEELLRQLGSEYQDDFTASKVAVARWLVRQGNSGTALVCFVASLCCRLRGW